jgi:hypothetical protein
MNLYHPALASYNISACTKCFHAKTLRHKELPPFTRIALLFKQNHLWMDLQLQKTGLIVFRQGLHRLDSGDRLSPTSSGSGYSLRVTPWAIQNLPGSNPARRA